MFIKSFSGKNNPKVMKGSEYADKTDGENNRIAQ